MRTPDPEGLVRARRVNDACERFETAWRRGERPPIAEFVRDGLDPREHEALLRELLALEVELRQEVGEPVDTSELLARFDGQGSVLETLLGHSGPRNPDFEETVAFASSTRGAEN